MILLLLTKFGLVCCLLRSLIYSSISVTHRDLGRINEAVLRIWKMSMDMVKHPTVYPTIKDMYHVPCVAFEDYKHVAMICYVS